MSLTGDISSITSFATALRRLPAVVAIKVAAAAAPALTEAARVTFDASEDAYGGSWVLREDGNRATLKKSGTLSSRLRYVAVGTRLRVALGTSYAKYVLGRRPALPRPGAPLPASYIDVLKRAVETVCKAELGR
jgi:hypothetical protein